MKRKFLFFGSERESRTQNPTARRNKAHFENLESRLLLSAELLGIPDWIEQGPGPAINGQVSGLMPGPNPVVGAIEAIAAHPTNPNVIYVGSIAGGIWKTSNGTAASPSWTPLTDQRPSLSISAIAFSPLDATNNTLFAGTGSFSSGGNGGPALGALRSTDGGNTWIPIGSEFSGERVKSIVPTSLGTSRADQVVLVATVDGGGVYRSTDGGNTFTLISGTSGVGDGLDNDADGTTDEVGERNLPFGNASHLVGDPGNANRFYAALPGQGVFRSDNGGANWIQVNTGLNAISTDGVDNDADGAIDEAGESIGGTFRIELSVHNNAGAGTNAVYAMFVSQPNNDRVMAVFRSANLGGNWAQITNLPQVSPGTQATIHASLLADQTNQNVVFIGGDRQAGGPFVANMFQGNAATNSWSSIVLGGAGGTAPHADSRDMVFDANGNILESDDGGIYRLLNPNAAGRTWVPVTGNIRVTQFNTNIDYDQLNNTIMGGAQDTGTPEQVSGFTWRDVSQADGGFVAVDNNQIVHPGTTIHYSSSQLLGGFTRTTLDNANTPSAPVGVGLAVAGAGGKTLTARAPLPPPRNVLVFDTSIQFTQPFVLNSIVPTQMLIGTSFLYESTNSGDTLTSLGGLNNLNANGLDDDLDGAVDEGDEFTAAGAIGRVSAMAYGGRSGGLANLDLAYVASGASLMLRTRNVAGDLTDFNTLAAYPGGAIRDIVLDPNRWQTAYVTDNDDVFATFDAGMSWTTLTGNLGDFTNDLRAIEFVRDPAPGGTDDIILVGGQGGVYRTLNASAGAEAVWTEFGGNLPNAIVTDVHYDRIDDILIAGTYGRGAWSISNVSDEIADAAILQILGDMDFTGQDDEITLALDENNPLILDVFVNSVAPILSVPFSTLSQITVEGLGGNDRLTLDFTDGNVIPISGLAYAGGSDTVADELVLQGGLFDSVAYTATGRGSGTISLDDALVSYSGVEPILDTTTAADRIFIFDSALRKTIQLRDAGPGLGLSAIDSGTTGDFAFETITFANPTDSLTVNGGLGDDSIDLLSLDSAFAALLTIDGRFGNDAIVVETTQTATTVNGGAGDDAMTVRSTGIGPLTLDGGAGSDIYAVVDFGRLISDVTVTDGGGLGGTDQLRVIGTAASETLTVTNAAVTRGSRTVGFSRIEELTVDARGGNDQFVVSDAQGTLLGGDGDDSFGVSSSGPRGLTLDGSKGDDRFVVSFGSLAGPVTVADTGGPGADSLIVLGTAERDPLFINATRVTRGITPGSPTLQDVNFFDIEDLTVDARAGDDHVEIRGALAEAHGMFFGGTGADEFLVIASNASGLVVDGESDSDRYTVLLGSLVGAVTVNDRGKTGTDELLVWGTPGPDMLVVTANAVERSPERVNYFGIELLSVYGDAGDDNFVVNESGASQLNLDGQGDSDAYTVFFGSLAGAVKVVDTGLTGVDRLTVVGTAGDDRLVDSGSEVSTASGEVVSYSGIEDRSIDGGAGDDTLIGSDPGGVTLLGGPGDDVLVGGPGDDRLEGGDGDDTLIGNAGADTLIGGAGDDILDGGDDGDIILSFAADSLAGGLMTTAAGMASRDLTENATRNLVPLVDGGDVPLITRPIDALPSSNLAGDTYVFAGGALGRDILIESAADGDRDRIDFSEFAGAVSLDLSMTSPQTVNPQHLILVLSDSGGIEDVIGSAFDDVIHGNDRDNQIRGGRGNDELMGSDGQDSLRGDDGDDLLEGGDGSDTLRGDAGDDLLIGDHAISLRAHESMNHNNAHRIRADLQVEAGSDLLLGGTGNDRLIGDNAITLKAEVYGGKRIEIEELVGGDLVATAGDDFLDGGRGHDLLVGDNTVHVEAHVYGGERIEIEKLIGGDLIVGAGDDELRGGAGDDRLIGDSAIHLRALIDAGRRIEIEELIGDNLEVGAGDDVLIGGRHDDLLVGDNRVWLQAQVRADRSERIEIAELVADDLRVKAGNDVLLAGAGDDHVIGDNVVQLLARIDAARSERIEIEELVGDDVEVGVGRDVLRAGRGDDTLIGDNSVSLQAQIRADNAERIEIDELLDGDLKIGAGDDDLHGGPGADFLIGDNRVGLGTRVMASGSKRIEIEGLVGDHLRLSTGDDRLDGGRGHDKLIEDNVVRGPTMRISSAACAPWVRHFLLDLGRTPTDNPNHDFIVTLAEPNLHGVRRHRV